MKHNDPIKNIMNTEVFTANIAMPLSEARKLFIQHNIHHLPVVDGSKLIGILSFTDVLRIDSGELYQQAPEQSDALLDSLSSVKQIMTTPVVTLSETDPIRQAVEILSRGEFHAIPIVSGDDIQGIVTSTDLFKYFLAQY